MPTPKKPASVHRIKGTYRDDRHGDSLEVETAMPDRPFWLSASAIIVWQELQKELEKAGYLSKLDGMALALYCELSAEFIANPPAFAPQKLSQMRALMGELGLTPSSRAKLPAPKNAKPANPFGGM